jgi:hypothetical protein
VSDEVYIFKPLAQDRSFQIKPMKSAPWPRAHGWVKVRDEYMLGDRFGAFVSGAAFRIQRPPDHGGASKPTRRRVALMVDELIGQQQVVIKIRFNYRSIPTSRARPSWATAGGADPRHSSLVRRSRH